MKNEYLGRWRIVEMEMWDRNYIDLVVPGYILFEENDLGEFQFGTVEGSLDYHIEPYEEKERLEFTWEGSAEMDPVSGRGWAIINEDGQLEGRLYFHAGDDSGFTAEKST
jgi:hypothetical protein